MDTDRDRRREQGRAEPAAGTRVAPGLLRVSDSSSVPPNRTLSERLVGGPEGLLRLLERLGPTFIKIGQFLALRPDIISQEYSDELLRLLDDVEPFPWREARAIIAQDLGDPEERFRSINPRPAAAGSMAQVHLAYLRDGTRVAVKVLRPGIAERVRIDLRRARALARLLRIAKVELIASPQELVDELESWLAKELDLRNELEHMGHLRRLTRDSRIEFVPRPYAELSSQRVLTAEFVQGIPVSEVLRAVEKGGEREVRRRGWPLHLDELAENLVEATLRQIFHYQFFHADVHPGNLIALADGAIGYVDFGLCEEIDENVRREQVRYLSTVYAGDVQQMFRALLEVLTPGEGADVEAFRADFVAESTKWLSRVRAGDEDTRNTRSPIAYWLIGVMRAARQNHFLIPTRLLAMYRTLLTAETVAHRLSPDVNLRSVGRDFFVSLQIDEALRTVSPDTLRTVFPRLLTLLRDSPAQVNQLLSELADGRFTLSVELTDDARTQRAKNRRTRLVTSAIASVGLAFLMSTPDLPALGAVPVRPLLIVALALVYVSLWIQWCRIR